MTQESRLAIVIDSRTAEQQAKDLKTVLDALERSGAKAAVTLSDVGGSAKGAGDKAKTTAESIGEMATALASVVSVGKLWAQVEKAMFAAGRYEQLGIVMNVVGRNAGYTSAELAGLEGDLRKTGIAMTHSRQVIAQLIQAEIDLAQATELARLAQNAATIAGINSSEAFERLVTGVQTSQTEMLRTMGITVNFEQAYKKLADELGRTTASLTEQEKTQARVNAVMEQGQLIMGAYEDSMDAAFKQMGSMQRLQEDLGVLMGEMYQPAFSLAIETLSASIEGAQGNAKALSIALAGVTTAAATATTGVLTLRYGISALATAFGALKAHPFVMLLSALAGGAAAAGIAFSHTRQDIIDTTAALSEMKQPLDTIVQKFKEMRVDQQSAKMVEYVELAERAARDAGDALSEIVQTIQSLNLLRFGLSRDDLDEVIAALEEAAEKGESLSSIINEFGRAHGIPESVIRSLLTLAGSFDKAREDGERAATVIDALKQALQDLRGEAGGAGSAASSVFEEFLKDVDERMRKMRMGVSAVARANVIIAENTDLTQEQRDAMLEAARAEDALRESLRKSTRSTKQKTDAGAEYIRQLQEQIALLGKETEYERLLAKVASGSLTFRTEKQLEAAKLLSQQLDDLEKQIEMEEVLRDLREQQSTTQLQFFRELEAFGQGSRVRELNADLARVEDRYRSIIDARRNSPLGLSDEELALIKKSLEEELDLVRWFHEQKLELQQDWKLGAIDALTDYADEAANVYDSVGRMVTNSFKGMEDAIVGFVRTGKLEFRDLADSIISDMIRIAVQQSITGPLASAIGGFFGGGGVNTSYAPDVSGFFSKGGYTGDGGKYEPAGIVHRGEGVLSQEEIRAIGGEAGFNALRAAIRKGHAVGGMGGRPALPPVAPTGAPSVELNIINQSGQPVAASQPQIRMDDMGRMVVDVMLTDWKRNGPYARQLKGALA